MDKETATGSTIEMTDAQWIIQGNIAVPTGNPLDPTVIADHQKKSEDQEDYLWLGPGLKLLLDHVIAVDQQGIIVWLAPTRESQELLQTINNTAKFLQLQSPLEFLCPGMIDLHIHAPQFAYTGTATDRPLTGPDGWLKTYTFPAESRLQNDLVLARQVYEGVVQTTLHAGTTTAVYFGTLHLSPNQILVDICLEYGQRALVGKVCMDRNSPTNYIQSLETNIQETQEFIQYIQHHPQNTGSLILPLITPRFIPTCTPQLLTALGELAAQHQCHITSHISESIDEVSWSRQLDSQDHDMERTDAAIFHSHGLLTDRCIMAHGVHLSDADMNLLRDQGTGIAHCPLSNFCFAGGVLPCRHLMERGNKVGLGTDVAGGYSPSMMNAARMTVVASQVLQIQQPRQPQQKEQQQSQHDTSQPLDYRHAVYLATLGGAEALGLHNQIGTFRVGMQFDAMVLSAKDNDSANTRSTISYFPKQDSLADVFQKLWVLGDDRNVTQVFVQGKEVKQLK